MVQESEGDWRRHLETETRSNPARPTSPDVARVPVLTLLGHPDLRRVGERAELFELTAAGDVSLSRLEPLFSAVGGSLRRPLADPHLSRSPIRLTRLDDGSLRLDPRQTRSQMLCAGQEPLMTCRDFSPAELESGLVLTLADRVALWLQLAAPTVPRAIPDFGLIGESSSMIRLRLEIERAADLEMPVLLRGETGTGKELVARAFHRASRRRDRPFVAVNMASLPPTLAAAELFGAVKGAYTGVDRRRRGYFERAHGGTLLLDEIGETATEVQALLLRALESREIQPLGSEESRAIDVRLIAATDADLEAAIEHGDFRAPLLHRLSGYELRLPPLRQRRDDIPRLFVHFLTRELEAMGVPSLRSSVEAPLLPARWIAKLVTQPWSGNVRQLRNVARQVAVLVRDGTALDADEAECLLTAAPTPTVPEAAAGDAEPRPSSSSTARPAEITEDELITALRAHRFRLKPTAAALGISRPALYRRIETSSRIRTAGELGRDELEGALAECGGDLDAMAERLEVSRHALTRRLHELGVLRPD